jgi:probable F420-dependent oxidoreductase
LTTSSQTSDATPPGLSVKFGVAVVPTDYSIGLTDLGQAVEERGFDALFFPEHTHIPTSRLSPLPRGGELPDEYRRSLDPFVALSAVAAVTKSILLGTGICLAIERDPIILAKEVASLDLISRGRVLFGVGGGWNVEEMRHHGTDPAHRWQLLHERVLAMRKIWTHEVAEFHGAFVDFSPLWQWPKPVQKPHPPILVGGNSPKTLERVADYGDGWLPQAPATILQLAEQLKELDRLCAARGRPRAPVTILGAAPDPTTIAEYAAQGVDRCVFWVPSSPPPDTIHTLDSLASLALPFRDGS